MGRHCLLAALIVVTIGCEEPTLSGPGVLSADEDRGNSVSPASLGSPTDVEPGVRRYETTLTRDGEPMKVFVYEPTAAAAATKRPCILIGPAGSNLITGMDLGEGDSPEHLPWARKGFVVVAYEIDGYVPDMQAASDEELRAAVTKFRDAEGGMANARAALDFALEKLPAIDAERIYAVGHSSAATLALQVTADDDRIAACIAFAPPTDLEDHLGEAMGALDQLVPGMREFVIESSPHNQVESLTCPVFIFHARDDGLLKPEVLGRYVSALKRVSPQAVEVEAPSGGHHQSMIDEGIPRAIEWVESLSGDAG